MSTIRYEGTFYSAYTEKEYTLSIYDTSGSFIKNEVTIIDCELTYLPGSETRFDTVMTAELTARLLINESGLDAFIEDIAGAYEGRFVIVLKQETTIKFIGYLLPDLAEQEDVPIEVGYQFTIKATDGLARLKTTDYAVIGLPYGGLTSFIDIMLRCLNKLTEVTDFYGTKSDFLKTRVNWHAQQYAYANTIDPLLNTKMPNRAFHTVDNKGNVKLSSCFDVLTRICKAWGARLLYSDGSFWFIQTNEMTAPTSLKFFTYTKTGTQTSETLDLTQTHDQNAPATTDVMRLSGGLFRFFPPLKFVQVDYKHIATENLLAGQTFDSASAPDPFVFGDISDQGGIAKLGVQVSLTYAATNRTDPPGVVGLWFVFGLRIEVAGLYLNRPIVFTGGNPVYGAVTWSSTSNSRYLIAVYVPENEDDNYGYVSFITPDLPASGEFKFDITLDKIYNGAGFEYGSPVATYVWNADNIYVEHLYEGTLNSQSDIRRFQSNNDIASNSATIAFETIIGDGIGLNSPGHLEVKDDTDAWVLADGWRVGNSGSFIPFTQLLAQEIIRGQLTPVRKWEGTYINKNNALLTAHNVIDRTDGKLVMMSGSFRIGRDEASGQWFYLNTASSGWSNETTVDFPQGEGAETGRPKSGQLTGDNSGIPNLKTFRLQVNGSDFPHTITENNGILPVNLAQFQLFMNGQLLSDNWYSVSGSVISLTFSPEKDDIFVIIFTTL
jgi:hypothetical protein